MKYNRLQKLESFKNTENFWKNSLEINKTKEKTKSQIENILENKNKINFSEINFDLSREKILAKVFWLKKEQIEKLEKDYEKNMTLSETISHAENYWEYEKI